MKLILNTFKNIVDRLRSFDNKSDIVNNNNNENCVKNPKSIFYVFE